MIYIVFCVCHVQWHLHYKYNTGLYIWHCQSLSKQMCPYMHMDMDPVK